MAPVFIQVHGVFKSYTARDGAPVVAVDDVNLAIAAGEFVSVVGPSGCGKSTLLSIVAGLVPATRGDVRIEGRPVRAPYTKVGNVLFQFDMRGQSARPFEGRARVLTIELPRPRDLDIRESPAFAQYVNRVNRLFQQMGVIGA